MSDARKKRCSGTIRKQDKLDNEDNRQNTSHKPYRGSRNVNYGGRRGGGNAQRVSSYDSIRKIVQEEGREARNLITWSVPVERTGRSLTRKEGTDLSLVHPVSPRKTTSKSRDSESHKSPKCEMRKKVDMRARYWAFMFDNIKRAVDAIYKTCEEDESVVECKEVIMMLDQSTRDFKNLIERLNVMKAYEEATKDGDRPTSITWEVRKMSPGKSVHHIREASISDRSSQPLRISTQPGQTSTQQVPPSISTPGHATVHLPVQRYLNFNNVGMATENGSTEGKHVAGSGRVSNSWADLVKSGSPLIDKPASETKPVSESKKEGGDSDGWETVQRNVRNKPRPLSASKQHPVQTLNKSKARVTPPTSSRGPASGRKSQGGSNEDIASKTPKSRMKVASPRDGNIRDNEKENTPMTCGKQPVLHSDRGAVTLSSDRGAVTLSSDRGAVTLSSDRGAVTLSSERGAVTLSSDGGTLSSDRGTVSSDRGTVSSERGTVSSDRGVVTLSSERATVSSDRGTVSSERATVSSDRGTVSSDRGTVNERDNSVTDNYSSGPLSDRLVRFSASSSGGCCVTGGEIDAGGIGDDYSDGGICEKLAHDLHEERDDGENTSGDVGKHDTEESLGHAGMSTVLADFETDDGMTDGEVEEMLTIERVDMRDVSTPTDDVVNVDDSVRTKHDKALAMVLAHEDQICTQLERQQEEEIEQVIQEEATWLKELARERDKGIEVDDCELTDSQTTTDSLDSEDLLVKPEMPTNPVSWADMTDDDIYIPPFLLKSQHKWSELCDDEVERTPGHAVLMHEKLSSPSRKRSLMETKLRHEQKQAKAYELRQKLLQEKSENLRTISNKVEEVRTYKEELLLQQKISMERKMNRADEKRCLQLKHKAQKAHEEEAKANEIAFINTLEAQNKRHDIIAKHQESEARLHDLYEERQKRLGEKLAKEAAVEERRRALEADRAARLNEMQEKRRLRDARVEQLQIEREKERVETMRIKEKDKMDRLAALNAQQQAHIEELQKKIQQKQNDSHRRHQEVLADIQLKAFEMAVMKHSTEDHNDAPTPTLYDHKKICTVCNILIHSEVYLLSHIRGKRHQQSLQESCKGTSLSKQDIGSFNLKSIVDAPHSSTHPTIISEKERQRALKKRCKKLRGRMVTRGNEYENSASVKALVVESAHKAKFQKVTKDINKYLQTDDRGPWPQNKVSALERALGEISRIMEKKVSNDQMAFRSGGGVTSLCRLLLVISDSTLTLMPIIPTRSLVLVCSVMRAVCKGCYDNCYYMLFNNKLGTLIDILAHQLNIMLPDTSSPAAPTPCADPLVTALTYTLTTVLACLARHNPVVTCSAAAAQRIGHTGDAFLNRSNDIIRFDSQNLKKCPQVSLLHKQTHKNHILECLRADSLKVVLTSIYTYIVCVGIADKLCHYFSTVQGSINELIQVGDLLHHSLGLLTSVTKLLSMRNSNPFEGPPDDPTQLINTFQATELVGIISLLYSTLLHSGAPARGQTPPPELPPHTVTFITTGIRTINTVAILDLRMLQGVLGEEGTSLQFRHIASYLIWYCSQCCCEELMHEVIFAVGYFTVLNTDNQLVIQSGQSPTVLQQLCALPFHYFSDPRLTNILFPTIMSCCYRNDENRAILEQELSGALIANFIEEKQLEAKLTPSLSRKGGDKDKGRGEQEARTSFMYRFPQDNLSDTIAYFTAH